MHHKPAPRGVRFLTDALIIRNVCRRRCMRRIPDVISLHFSSYTISILSGREGWKFSRNVFSLYFFLSSFILCPSIHHSTPPLVFENMIMIKRTKMVRLGGPAMPAPPGMHSNFVNPSNLRTEGLILQTICLILATLVVSMRMWTKTRLVRKVVLEDCKSTFFRSSLLHLAY